MQNTAWDLTVAFEYISRGIYIDEGLILWLYKTETARQGELGIDYKLI